MRYAPLVRSLGGPSHRSPQWGLGAGCASRPLSKHPPSRRTAVGSGCALLSTKSFHPCTVVSRFFMLAPSGPRGSQFRGAAHPPPVCQPLPPAPCCDPVSQRAHLPCLPLPLEMTSTCKDYAQPPGPPTADSLSERCNRKPWPPPSRRPPLSLRPPPCTASSPPTSYLHSSVSRMVSPVAPLKDAQGMNTASGRQPKALERIRSGCASMCFSPWFFRL